MLATNALRLQGSTLAVGLLSFGLSLSGVVPKLSSAASSNTDDPTVATEAKQKRKGNKEMEEFDNPMARAESEDESVTVKDQSVNEK